MAFASPNIGEAHADMSSGAAEVYALGNAVMDTLAFSYAVEEMGLEFELPFIMEVDNEAARIFAQGTGGRTKSTRATIHRTEGSVPEAAHPPGIR